MSEDRVTSSDDERMRRWRLILGGGDADGIAFSLYGDGLALDRTLTALYDSERKGGLGSSAPSVARWLGDIREYFPASVVRVMQRDALERLDLKQLLTQPELLASIEPDVHLVATLLSLKSILPAKARETARQVVRTVVEDVERRLAEPLRQSVRSSLDRAARTRRPRHHEIDWQRTIRANLRHYQPEYRTIIPEQRIGYGRRGMRPARHHSLHGPERLDGRVGGVRGDFRRRVGFLARGQHACRRLRYGGGRSERPALRPGRAALRHAAGRRHRYQPRPGVLPDAWSRTPKTRSWCSSATCTRAGTGTR